MTFSFLQRISPTCDFCISTIIFHCGRWSVYSLWHVNSELLDMHLTVHKILYWYWSEIATVIVLSPPTWIFLGIFCFVFLKFVFCSCFAWKAIRSDVSCTTHFNILDKFSYVFIPVDRLLIWFMGRYLTSGMNIPPTSNPRVILSVLCHPDFSVVAFVCTCIYIYIYLYIYILLYFYK